jgi:outer membrane assembly lipoprotein YfiO
MSLYKRVLGCLALVAVAVPFTADAQWVWTPQTGRWVNVDNLPKETPELQVEYARSLFLEGDYKKAMNETQKFEKFYSDTDLADENKFLRGEILMAQGKYLPAAKEYQQMLAAHPDTELYDEAIAKQYEIGDALYEEGQQKLDKRWTIYRKRPLRRAGEVYAMVVENQPFTPQAAEAQYKIGLTQHTRKNYTEAAFEYRRVVEDYGGSEWVDDASFGLASAYYEQSLPPEYDQTPSELAIRAIDDFQGMYPADERNPDLADKRKQMRDKIAAQRLQTAQYYEKRREFQSAKIYYNVVAEEYSDTAAADQAREWLAQYEHINPLPYDHLDAEDLQ